MRVSIIHHVEESAMHCKQAATFTNNVLLDFPINVTVSGKIHNFAPQRDFFRRPKLVVVYTRPTLPYGFVIFSGRTSWSNSSAFRCPSFTAASRRLVCST